ncbi:MAG: N-glycosylase/DNA lyase [Candidatus Lokiarchaeota archaeon]|nr:N-glycosylase/DNA lyase [Candidatus Lokiarchaeota archaeon]
MPADKELLDKIEALKRSSTKNVVDQRMNEFKAFRARSSHDNFKELCFCILTGNCGAEASLKIHAAIGDRFLTCSCAEEFTTMLKENGGRFYNHKGKYLASACQYRETLKEILDSFGDDEQALREWLVEHVDGFGYKESSHFMRNVGYENVAIIDFHIVDLLVAHGLVERPKALSKKRYLEIEQVLRGIAGKVGLSLGALDLYLWSMETGGKILK